MREKWDRCCSGAYRGASALLSKSSRNKSSLIRLFLILLQRWADAGEPKPECPRVMSCLFLRKLFFFLLKCVAQLGNSTLSTIRELKKSPLWMWWFVANLLFLFLPAASKRMTTRWRCALMTIWTSSAPTTPMERCRRTQPSATCCTWWRGRTTRCVSLTPSISSVGNARAPSLPTRRRNSLRNSSASRPSPWGTSSSRGRAITTSVSVISFFFFFL